MRNFLFTIVLGSFIFLAADCNNEEITPTEAGVLELNFKGDFGDEPLMMFAKDYNYQAGMKVRFQLFRFYISSIAIQNPNTPGMLPLEQDIALIDFKDIQSADKADQGITLRMEVAPGNYSGVSFGVGVADFLNKTNPGDYTPTHPLSDNYWSASKGYVFTKIEGNADVDGDGQLTDKITFHIGGDTFYRQKNYNKTFTVNSGATTRLNFEVDLQKVLVANASNYVDFKKVTIDHTNDLDLANFISDNLANAIELKSN